MWNHDEGRDNGSKISWNSLARKMSQIHFHPLSPGMLLLCDMCTLKFSHAAVSEVEVIVSPQIRGHLRWAVHFAIYYVLPILMNLLSPVSRKFKYVRASHHRSRRKGVTHKHILLLQQLLLRWYTSSCGSAAVLSYKRDGCFCHLLCGGPSHRLIRPVIYPVSKQKECR